MNKKVVIVDGNNYCYRAWYRFTNMKSNKGVGTALIYGVPYMLSTLIKSFRPDIMYVVIDGKRSVHRLSMLPDYKGGRLKLGWDPDEFHRQKDDMMDLVHNSLGVHVMRNKNQEADDMMYKLVRKHKGDKITLCSADKDFRQLISEDVSIWDHNLDARAGVLLNSVNCKSWTGYEPRHTVDYLTFLGDGSDNIPGMPGVGEKGAAEFFEEFDSIKEFLKSDRSFKKVDKDKLAKVYHISKSMIDLKYFHRKHLRKVKIEKAFPNESKVDYSYLKELALKYSINSFRIPNFIKTFKK